MRGILATLIAVAVLGGVSARAAAPVEPGKVFVGSEGEMVSVVPLTPVDDKKAILLVQGTGSELDGKVFPYDVEQSGQDVRYVTQLHGRRYVTLYLLVSGNRRSHYLNIPGRRDDTPVSYDDKRSQSLKPEDIYSQHQKQKGDGSLTKLMAFDRKAEVADLEKDMAETVKAMNDACASAVKPVVDWSGITDEMIKTVSISSFCEAPYDAFRRLCKESAEARKIVQTQVKEISCRFGDGLKLELQGSRINWITSKEGSNQSDFAMKYFVDNLDSTRGQGEKLSKRMHLEKLRVCTDGKGHYVVIEPHEQRGVQLAYGDGKSFIHVEPPPWVINGHHFLEPRFYNKTMNHSFRGLDMGLYSEVEVDADKNTCAVRCGDRNIPLTWVAPDEAEKMVAAARYEPNPQKFVPYALLRDSQGRYYLVERGFLKSEERNFRVSIGPKGSLQVQKMKDVVSDSKGEIFSTMKGDLRLVVDREAPSSWIEKKQRVELRAVPIDENLPLIYNELGVYTGARLGTPCDDM